MRVLIAEDDDVSRFLLERLLQKMGHEYISTTNGLEGLEAFKRNDFNMAILDWMMPEMDGITLCRKIREIEAGTEKHLFIFMVTAKSEAKDMLHALVAGVDDFLTKPVDRTLLEQRVKMGMIHQEFIGHEQNLQKEPYIVLTEEHHVCRKLIHILDVIYDKLENGVPVETLSWLTSSLSEFTLKIHQDKESIYLQSFVNAITTEHVDWFSQISESSFITLADEHEEMECLLMNMQGEISRNILSKNPIYDPLKRKIKSYTDLLLKHIQMEEKLFFPFAEKYISADDKLEIISKFEDIDKEIGVANLNQILQNISEFLNIVTKDENAISTWRPRK